MAGTPDDVARSEQDRDNFGMILSKFDRSD